jgi:hypothetical protein
MPLAYTITLEKEVPTATPLLKAANGKALAREFDRIELAAKRKSVGGIAAFLSESQAKLIEQMKADGFDPSKMRLPPERFYPASHGLKSVRTLIAHITANLNDFKQPNPILRDLKTVEAILTAAETAGVQFHYTRAEG